VEQSIGVRVPSFAISIMKIFLSIFFLAAPLYAEHFKADPTARSYASGVQKRHRVDTFDFSGIFPELEHIDIDATRKKNVSLDLTGEYPQLTSINYRGSFGKLTGSLTGKFPLLSQINLLCTSCGMDLDLNARWQQSCVINIQGQDEDITLNLPKDVGLVIHTKTKAKGKVVPCEELKKKNRFGIFNKIFENDLAETSPIVITLNVELADGRIILK
jgi:hypothetical protein